MQILDIDTSDEALQAEMLGGLLFDMYLPKKILDVGCNSGLYLAPFLAKGCEVMGYDNAPASKPFSPMRYIDLTCDRINDFGDLTLCLEVLEHIPAKHAEWVLTSLCETSDKLIFSAAQPGAGGVGHVNCQPKEYWKEKIVRLGFEYCQVETDFIVGRMTKPGVMGWLLNNLMVFRRKMEYPYKTMAPTKIMGDITAVVTSCGRFDLLKKTLDSFNNEGLVKRVIISDDSEDTYQHDLIRNHYYGKYDIYIHGKNRGQADNLDWLYEEVDTEYILHLEDDWEFILPGAVEESLRIMEEDKTIGLVQLDLRPAYFRAGAVGEEKKDYFEYNPWRISDNHVLWFGSCGSPHLIRKSTWKEIGKFSSVKNETDYDSRYGQTGLRTVWAKRPFVRHIGYGRSTMGDYQWIK